MTKISGHMTKVPPHLTWGEMTSRQLDQLPMGIVNKQAQTLHERLLCYFLGIEKVVCNH